MFIDQVTIRIESGTGGNGMVAWRREKFVPNGGPAGGDGGKGGDVWLVATSRLNTLLELQYQSQYKAEVGENGRHKNQHGKQGNDLRLAVPCGTTVTDTDSGQVIADLIEDGQQVLVAAGGRGGRGNARFLNSVKQAPHYAEPGEVGIIRTLTLELKLLADVGIIGLPNAGKSTLISVISAARPKIADYPFTTLIPNLGVVRHPSGDGVVFADIPGLVEGASEGVGLGHAFLRHVERTRLLLHLVDATQDDPIGAYQLINQELARYSPTLAQKPQLVTLTKADALEPGDLHTLQRTMTQATGQSVWVISSLSRAGLDDFMTQVWQAWEALPPLTSETTPIADDTAAWQRDDGFEVIPCKTFFEIKGDRLIRLMQTTDMGNPPAVHRLMNIYKAMGLFKELVRWGAQPGDTVRLGGREFIYDPEAWNY